MVSNSIRLSDHMTPVIRNISAALNMTINTMQALDNEVNQGLNANSFEGIRSSIASANAELNRMDDGVEEVTREQNRANRSTRSWLGNAIKLGAAYFGIRESIRLISAGVRSADNFILSTARIDLINDGLQTTASLQTRIYNATQDARGNYADMTNSVSKLGMLAKDAFSGNLEIVQFGELMAKSFKVGGASAQEQSSAMYQLTQAMAAGRLQGDEFRSISENAPMLAQAIATQMGVAMGELKEMSSEGLITSDIIKAAMFSAADEINAKFEAMPRTWADMMQSVKNTALMEFQPVINMFSNFINSSAGESLYINLVNLVKVITNAITNNFSKIISAVSNAVKMLSFLVKNFRTIATIVKIATIALITWRLAMSAANIAVTLSTALATTFAIAQSSATVATETATVATLGFNAALMANPIGLVAAAVAGLTSLVLGLGIAFNKAGESAVNAASQISIFDKVGGISRTNLPYVEEQNRIQNEIAKHEQAIAENRKGVEKKGVETGIDKAIVRDHSDAIDALEKQSGYYNSRINNTVGAIKGLSDADLKGLIEAQDKEKYLSSLKSSTEKEAGMALPSLGILADELAKGNLNPGIFEEERLRRMTEELEDFKPVDMSIPEIQKVSVVDTVDVSSEDLKLLRDIATQQAIQNFVTLTPTVQVQTGDINNGADIDTIVSEIQNTLEVDIAANAKGVYGLEQ